MATESVDPDLLEVEDPGELTKTKHVSRISRARDDVDQVRQRAWLGVLEGELPVQQANSAYRLAIETYALALAPLLCSDEHGDDDLWAASPIASVDVGEETVVLAGVKDLLDGESPIRRRAGGFGGSLEEGELSRADLDRFVRALDQFARDAGLGLQTKEEVTDMSDEPF